MEEWDANPFDSMEFDLFGDVDKPMVMEQDVPLLTSPLSLSDYTLLVDPPSRLYADEEELQDILIPDAPPPPADAPPPPVSLTSWKIVKVTPFPSKIKSKLQNPAPTPRTAPLPPIPRPRITSPPSSPRRKNNPRWTPSPWPVWGREPEGTFVFEPFPDQFSCPLRILRAQLWSYIPQVRGQRWLKIPPILRALRLALLIGMLSYSPRRTIVACSLPFLTAIHVPHWGWLMGRLAAAMSLIEYCDRHGMHDEGGRSPTED